MTLSLLIETLQQIKDDIGDLDVRLEYEGSISTVGVDEDDEGHFVLISAEEYTPETEH